MHTLGDHLDVRQTLPGGEVRLHLLDGPYVTMRGARLEVPEGSKRLLAFVAMQRGRLERRYVAGSLWPVGDDNRAAGNLRSALWRLRGAGVDIIDADKWALTLSNGVSVDIDDISDWSDRVLSHVPNLDDYLAISTKIRALDILPGCYDDWVISERERLRQRVLHALEEVSRLLVSQARFGEAVEAAMAAVFCEPLRESAQRALIESHLAEGNLVEARRVFHLYARLLRQELGIDPSVELQGLVRLSRQPRAVPKTGYATTAAPSSAASLSVVAYGR